LTTSYFKVLRISVPNVFEFLASEIRLNPIYLLRTLHYTSLCIFMMRIYYNFNCRVHFIHWGLWACSQRLTTTWKCSKVV